MQDSVKGRAMEAQRQVGLIASFGWIAVSVLVTISIVNVYQESYAFVLFTAGFAAVIVSCIASLYAFGWLRPIIHIYGILMILLTAGMIVSGGVQGNGFLWLFILPAVCFYLMGHTLGATYVCLILATIMVLFFTPVLAEFCYTYPFQFKIRFLLAILGCAGISMAAEISRCQISRRYHLALDELELATLTDPLTGLLNRRGGLEKLEHHNALARRNKLPYSVLMVDVDHFKKVNDVYGHATGDVVLKEFAKLFLGAVRDQDNVIRWGGEEFLFVLPLTDLSGALQVAGKLCSAVKANQISTTAGALSVTCSVGVAEVNEPWSYEQTIARADALLYIAKQKGRDRVEG